MPEVLVTVSGLTGSGKSAVASEIEIALRAIGVRVTWADGARERKSVPAETLDPGALADLTVTMREVNSPRIPPGYFPPEDLAHSKAPD
jgi:Mrp family chromosome partitioning ATPase